MRGFFLWKKNPKIMKKSRKYKESGRIYTEKLRKIGGEYGETQSLARDIGETTSMYGI